MGTAIIAKNSNAETAGMRKFIPPVTRNLEAWHFLNTDVSKAATNYAMGKPDAVIVGAPSEFPEYIQFKALSNFLQTSVPETATMTTFSVVRTKDTLVDYDHRPAYYGNFGEFSLGGSYLAVNDANRLVKASCRFLDAEQTTHTTAQISLLNERDTFFGEWALIVDVTKTNFNSLTDATRGVTTTSGNSTTYGRKVSPVMYRIGSIYNSSVVWKGTSDMALFAHYSTELSESEIALVVARIRAYMLQRFGIVV